MRYTKTFIPTVKEAPADAEIISHQLMIRAGLMRKLASGTYTYLPAGWRVLRKIMEIIRQEMDRAGAIEILLPMVQPAELWQKTGRDIDYGQTLGTFTDRHGRLNVLSPTAEEAVTFLAAGEINSYKQLPVNFYQINLKYRDEFRPRFGVLRSREFIMKDAYSFHPSPQCLDKTYRAMYDAYCRIFTRCGLDYVIVQAETGEMGGTGSHQFTVPCDNGEDTIVYTEDDTTAWNIEKAPIDPLPKEPPVQAGAIEYVHTPGTGKIEDVCGYMKVPADRLIKCLVYKTQDKPVMVLLRGDHEVNQEKLTQLADGRHIELADEASITKLTGAAVGFAGPVGLSDKAHMIFIDHSIAAMNIGVAGANRTDYHIKNVVPGRDFPLTGSNIRIVDVRRALQGDTYNGKKLLFKRGIEVGQVFKLGIKYSTRLDAKFLDADGTEKPCLMGCYGIGVNRILAAAIERGHDKDGMILPVSIAPWEVIITPVGAAAEITALAEKLHGQLEHNNIETLLDDRDLRAGVKFKDADLLGIPVRITVGEKALAQGKVEVKQRCNAQNTKVDIGQCVGMVVEIVKELKAQLGRKT